MEGSDRTDNPNLIPRAERLYLQTLSPPLLILLLLSPPPPPLLPPSRRSPFPIAAVTHHPSKTTTQTVSRASELLNPNVDPIAQKPCSDSFPISPFQFPSPTSPKFFQNDSKISKKNKIFERAAFGFLNLEAVGSERGAGGARLPRLQEECFITPRRRRRRRRRPK
ncbi:hypothetical protein Droror1_Dr00011861 [Drosera rotundifolia]